MQTIRYRGAVYRLVQADVTRRPWTFYHGTDSGLFQAFDPSVATKGGQFWNPLGDGMYVTDQLEFARSFGSNVHQVVIPTGARYRRINLDTWQSAGKSLVLQAMRDALKAVGEPPIRDIRTRLGLDFLVDLNKCFYGNSPYEALYESAALVDQSFGSDVAGHYEKALPKRANQKFKQYDFIVFTETNDPVGHYDEKSSKIKSALEVVIFNPLMQKTQPVDV